MNCEFDVVVVGGGHAGTEAAAAVARLGLTCGLVSLETKAVGRMSCNPAIGGIGKGQLAREVDALGGLMGLATDQSGIQFRMLNTRKGKAVQSPRAQCDRDGYEKAVQALLAQFSTLTMVEGEAVEVGFSNHQVEEVLLADGRRLGCRAAILTTGTFLEGVLHTGLEQKAGGRHGEAGAARLGDFLRSLGLPTGRMKTGTPPRIAADSVNYSVLEEQPGDENPVAFSFMTDALPQAKVVCWTSQTTPATHQIVRDNLDKAPMYAGRIDGRGPRYCPSLEDKVVRFADRDHHNIFLEPEAVGSPLLYANGISTSLPVEVQESFVRTCVGLENARIVQPGYAVEYTFMAPRSLRRTLELKDFPGLYFAGQICGTSGYEEAAAQGIMAGFNAALKIKGEPEFILGRHEAYIGVLLDDLVVSNPEEPYRMFTSRAEHRLLLRHDNADRRLTRRAHAFGGVKKDRMDRLEAKEQRLSKALQILKASLDKDRAQNKGKRHTWLNRLRQPDGGGWAAALQNISALNALNLSTQEGETLAADIQYEGYARRQEKWVARGEERESTQLPDGFAFAKVLGLRAEAVEHLADANPATLGAASRLAGVTPADIALLEIAIARGQ